MILADLGARVDKLEDPQIGDYLRITPPLADDGMGTIHHWVNRGKRSVALDLKKPEGRDALLKLVPRYDVLLESNRPGVMERLGIGYETLRAIHPGLVYCAITGYGKDGPLAHRAGHDLNYIARAGILSFMGPVDRPPQVPSVQIADIGGGLFGVIGILAALTSRSATGEGRFVDISMNEAALSFAVVGLAQRLGGFAMPRGADVLMGGIAPYQVYETKDGGYVSLGALEPKFWQAFCGAVGIEGDMSAIMPGPQQADLQKQIREIVASRTKAEWAEFASQHDCCLEVVSEPDEVLTDAHLEARGAFGDRETGKGTRLRMARTPVAPLAEGRAPARGADSDAVLRDAGFSQAEIDALVESGVSAR
jgi:crotonobetainyl-CoA:carnitine CoA-transferase CaiB-like acyl-CoA transferase